MTPPRSVVSTLVVVPQLSEVAPLVGVKKARRRWSSPAGALKRLLTLQEAASYLGLSPWTVRELQWKGRLPRVRLSRKLLFDREDLDRLIEAEKDRP